MDVCRFLVRRRLRRHGLRVIALSLLVALVGGVVIASVLGADRSRTSMGRFIDDVDAADVGVFVGSPDGLEPLVDHPDIRQIGQFTMPALFPTSILDRDDVFIPFAAFAGGEIPYEFNRYRILDGRLPDPNVVTEIALHESTAEFLDVGVGGRIEMAMFTPEELEQVFGYGDLPDSFDTIDMDVVAVMRDPLDVIARPTDIVVTPLTPAASERFADLGSIGGGALIGLRAGASADAFSIEVAELIPQAEIERWVGGMDLGETGFGSTLDVIGDGLVAVAIVVSVAGLVAVGQAFARTAVAARREDELVASLGLDRRQRRLVALAPGGVVAVFGGIGAGVVAAVLSPLFPIAIARRAEPDPGFDLDPGIAVGAVLVIFVALGLALGATAAVGRRQRSSASRGVAVLPTPDPIAGVVGSGNAALARSTQVAVAFGGLAVAAALVFAASLSQLLDSPRQYGWSFDAAVVSETNDATLVRDGLDVAEDPAVAEAAEALFQIQLTIDDLPGLGYAIGDGTGNIGPVVARGRSPEDASEVALGRETLRQLGVDLGDEVVIDGDAGPETFEVVGQAIIPVSSDGGRVGSGATFVTQALPALGVDGADGCEQSSCYRQVVVRWEEGADLEAAAGRMLAEESAEFVRPVPPAEVERLSEVDAMPWVVAGLLSVLACAAAVHAVVVTVQRRRRDLAVLRALGATPAQNRRAVSIHVAALVAVWAVAGTALGIVVGRATWRAVAGSVGVATVPEVPLLAVIALPVGILVLTQLAAAIPARNASRSHASQVLRSE